MTPEAITALALHRAAEVARKYAADCRVAADDLTSKRHIFSAQREINAAYDADKIADAILSLAPMSPLQAALQVPEVRALVGMVSALVDLTRMPDADYDAKHPELGREYEDAYFSSNSGTDLTDFFISRLKPLVEALEERT